MKNIGKLIMLASIFVGGMITANFASVKIAQIGWFTIPAGTLMFAITFLCTDIIADVWGKKVAHQVVTAGFVANLISLVAIRLYIKVPFPEFWEMQKEFVMVFGSNARIVIAGLVTYLVSQHIDVALFLWIKSLTGGKKLWLRNNVSTITSQLIDTVLFTVLAFAGTMPVADLVNMIASLYLLKVLIALGDTPFCYLGVKWASREN